MGAGALNIERLLNEAVSENFIISNNTKQGQVIVEKQVILKAGQEFRANAYWLRYYADTSGNPNQYVTNYDFKFITQVIFSSPNQV